MELKLKKCALRGSDDKLEPSHIIPPMVVRALKKTSVGAIRNMENPNQTVQDSEEHLIASGVYGFPKDEALNIALTEIWKFLLTHEMKVILVGFSCIRCKEDYKPKKKTVVAFAIALELDMPTTLDLLSRIALEVTYNHPEGIEGAEATASAIFLARNGSGKDAITAYIIQEFGYDLTRICNEIRPTYHHVETCRQTVPEAITAYHVEATKEHCVPCWKSIRHGCMRIS